MTDERLHFNPDDLGGFDSAGTPGVDDLAGFDAATGATFVPAGTYLCRLESGELVQTRAGKTAYRLRFAVVEPTEHGGVALWRWCVLTDPDAAKQRANFNRAKDALAPLGFKTQADLRRSPFPEVGRVILCRVLAGIQKRPDGSTTNDVIRFTVEKDQPAAPNPFAVPLDGGEGANP